MNFYPILAPSHCPYSAQDKDPQNHPDTGLLPKVSSGQKGRGGADSGLKVTPSGLLERDTPEAMLLDQGPGQLSFRGSEGTGSKQQLRDGGRNWRNGFS